MLEQKYAQLPPAKGSLFLCLLAQEHTLRCIGSQVAAMLAMGADGVVLGTRLVPTPESTLADAKKVRSRRAALLPSWSACPFCLPVIQRPPGKLTCKCGATPAAPCIRREARGH